MLINKEDNLKLTNKSRIAFNYHNVFKQISENYLELSLKVYDYLSDSHYLVFFQADLKHAYYTILLHPED